MNKFLGIALILVAIAVAVVPQYTDCLSQGKTVALANGSMQPMKCHWSAQAEIAAAIPLAGVGILIAASRRKSLIFGASILGVLLGAMALAIPNSLIGTCGMASMFCNTAMKPSLNALGAIAVVGSLGGVVMSWKSRALISGKARDTLAGFESNEG